MKQILTTALLVVVANFVAIPTVSADVGVSVVFSQKEISIIGTWYQLAQNDVSQNIVNDPGRNLDQ